MKVSGQLPVPAVLPPEKMPPVVTELEAEEGGVCVLEAVWVMWGKRKNYFLWRELNCDSLTLRPSAQCLNQMSFLCYTVNPER
jgi:hypothetical protein